MSQLLEEMKVTLDKEKTETTYLKNATLIQDNARHDMQLTQWTIIAPTDKQKWYRYLQAVELRAIKLVREDRAEIGKIDIFYSLTHVEGSVSVRTRIHNRTPVF